MMSLYDICSKFPTVKLSDAVSLNERNLFSAEMEDGSGYSWNLKADYDGVVFDIYARFDKTCRECTTLTLSVGGKQIPLERYVASIWVPSAPKLM